MQPKTLVHASCRIILPLALSLGIAAASGQAADLRLLTEEYPPLNMSGPDGEATGYATELVKAAADLSDISLDIRILPWKRAYQTALTTPDTCVYSTWRTEEREPLFLWIGPLDVDAWSFLARVDSPIRLSRVEDTFDHAVGAVEGWGFTEYLRALPHPNLDLVPADDEINARKLLLGRIDLWATGRLTGQAITRKPAYRGIREIFSIREIDLSVACNLQSDRSVIDRLQEAVNRLEANGEAARIRANYAP